VPARKPHFLRESQAVRVKCCAAIGVKKLLAGLFRQTLQKNGAQMKHYKQLTTEQRYQISGLKKAGLSQS